MGFSQTHNNWCRYQFINMLFNASQLWHVLLRKKKNVRKNCLVILGWCDFGHFFFNPKMPMPKWPGLSTYLNKRSGHVTQFAPEHGRLEGPFLLGPKAYFQGKMLVSGKVLQEPFIRLGALTVDPVVLTNQPRLSSLQKSNPQSVRKTKSHVFSQVPKKMKNIWVLRILKLLKCRSGEHTTEPRTSYHSKRKRFVFQPLCLSGAFALSFPWCSLLDGFSGFWIHALVSVLKSYESNFGSLPLCSA